MENPFPYNISAFVPVPEGYESMDIMKSWVRFFTLASGLENVHVGTAYPDDTRKLKIPSLILTRVGDERWQLGRSDGFHGVVSGETSSTLSELRGYRVNTVYQFDLYAKTRAEQTQYESLIQKLLRRNPDQFAEDAVGITEIPVYDYSDNPTSVSGTLTSSRIKFKSFQDVSVTEVPNVFDKQVHQSAISVTFWCDVLQSKNYSRIQHLSVSGEIAE